MPSASAPSLPGRTRSHRSALAARPARRGSTTITRAPRAWATTASVARANHAVLGLCPQNSTQPVFCNSGGGRRTPKVDCDAKLVCQKHSSLALQLLGLPKVWITLGPGAPHRVQKPLRVIDQFWDGAALGA